MTSKDYVVSCKYCRKVLFDTISVKNSLAGIEAAFSNAILKDSEFVNVTSGSVFTDSSAILRDITMERSRGVISTRTNLTASAITIIDSVGFYADGDGNVDVRVKNLTITSQKNNPFAGEYIL